METQAIEGAAAAAPQPEPAAAPHTAGIERITVRAGGKKTSVSLDTVLYRVLVSRVGGVVAAAQWVQAIVNEIDRLENMGLYAAPRDVHAGLSRLVQRQVFRMFLSA